MTLRWNEDFVFVLHHSTSRKSSLLSCCCSASLVCVAPTFSARCGPIALISRLKFRERLLKKCASGSLSLIFLALLLPVSSTDLFNAQKTEDLLINHSSECLCLLFHVILSHPALKSESLGRIKPLS